MSNEHCLMLQANIICLLLSIFGTAAMDSASSLVSVVLS
jgi:hypothetical protein